LKAGHIRRPVDLIRAFGRFGLKAKKAGNIVDRLAKDEVVPAELSAATPAEVIETLKSLGVSAWEIKTPEVEPKKVRAGLNLSQPEFAALYDLELDTLQNWEQGRNSIDRATRVLLKVIEKNPSVVLQALTDSDDVYWSGRHLSADRRQFDLLGVTAACTARFQQPMRGGTSVPALFVRSEARRKP
jgi:DNA-binding transcriptional regulator YiaG